MKKVKEEGKTMQSYSFPFFLHKTFEEPCRSVFACHFTPTNTKIHFPSFPALPLTFLSHLPAKQTDPQNKVPGCEKAEKKEKERTPE